MFLQRLNALIDGRFLFAEGDEASGGGAPAEPATPESAPVEPAATAADNPPAATDGQAAPGADAPPEAPASHTDEAGLLSSKSDEKPAEEAKPEAEKPAEPEKPAEAEKPPETEQKPEPEPEPIKYEALALPEGVTLDQERISAFDDVIGPHRLPPEARQQLADMHVAEMQRYAEHLAAEQHRVFADTRRTWREAIMSDPEFGGSGFETSRAAAVRMLQKFVPEGERDDFDAALMATGMTDHPQFFRFLNRIAKAFDEPASPPPNAAPPPDAGRRPGGRLSDMYDHPRSPRSR